MISEAVKLKAKPAWLKVRVGGGPNYERVRNLMSKQDLHTVCDEALCPNKGRCWEHGRATIMILGGVCSRNCRFCNVENGTPGIFDSAEPYRVAEAVKNMGLREIVITSVTRDDLPDGGASAWAESINRIRELCPGIIVEVLVPDFGGREDLLRKVLDAGPDIVGHNLETVPSLYSEVRPQADYGRSLELLKRVHDSGMIAKTGLMLGLGEISDEVISVMRDARGAGCDIFFAGQYLQPSDKHLDVVRFVAPEEFDMYRKIGLEMGFSVVVSSPLVRSSFHTEEQFEFLRTIKGD